MARRKYAVSASVERETMEHSRDDYQARRCRENHFDFRFEWERCPTCQKKAQAAETTLSSSKDEIQQIWGRFFQDEKHWAIANTRYNPDYDDPPIAGVLIEWALEYPEGRLVAYGEACEAFVKWLQKTQDIKPEAAIARYMPTLQGQNILDAYDPWDIEYVLPFTPKCCPASLMILFGKPIGWVYFLGEEEGSNFIKIGYCFILPKKRLEAMKPGNHRRLRFLRAVPCSRHMAPRYEKFLHKLFAKYRQGKTEWFAIDMTMAEEGYNLAVAQNGSQRYFWTYEQWTQHDEAEEERLAEHYEQYPWEDPENEEWLSRE